MGFQKSSRIQLSASVLLTPVYGTTLIIIFRSQEERLRLPPGTPFEPRSEIEIALNVETSLMD